MYYAQFFQYAVGTTNLIEAYGDRSVIILDGREPLVTHHFLARKTAKERGYVAYQLFKGESFTRSSPITSIRNLNLNGGIWP